MRSQVLEKRLTDTSSTSWLGSLENNLVDQFQALHEDERTKAFLGQETPEGTVTGDFLSLDPKEKPELPLLSFTSSEPLQTAVALQKWEGLNRERLSFALRIDRIPRRSEVEMSQDLS
jgi:hypothetical protein